MILFGVILRSDKRVYSELMKIYGIGKKKSFIICNKLLLLNKCVCDITMIELSLLKEYLSYYTLGSDLKNIIKNNINRLINIGCYRGLRIKKGLPCHGQRTKTNSKTVKYIFKNKLLYYSY